MDNQPSSYLLELLGRFKIPIALSLVGLVLILGGLFTQSIKNNKDSHFAKESIVESKKLIQVDVSGAVVKVGVYQLTEGARVEDAIKAAGGFSPSANKEYISRNLNMAQKLSDGSKIYVPAEGETLSGGLSGQSGVVAGSEAKSMVNINTASQAELEALPAVGPVTASKIISDRPYQNPEDLLNKKVVSKAVFEKIKDSITIY